MAHILIVSNELKPIGVDEIPNDCCTMLSDSPFSRLIYINSDLSSQKTVLFYSKLFIDFFNVKLCFTEHTGILLVYGCHFDIFSNS